MLPFELQWGQSSMGGWSGLLGLKPRGTVLDATVGRRVGAGRPGAKLGSFGTGNGIGGLAGSGTGLGSFRCEAGAGSGSEGGSEDGAAGSAGGGAGPGSGSGAAAVAAGGSGSAGRERRSA